MSGGAPTSLVELAGAYGVQASYTGASGRRVRTPTAGLVGALRALGVDIDGPAHAGEALERRRTELARRLVEPVVIAWDGRLRDVAVRAPRSARVRIEADDGGRVDAETRPAGEAGLSVSAREPLPTGYHTLHVETRSACSTATVFAAPMRAPAIPAGSWSVFAPTYALRCSRDRDRDWGIGSFSDLRDLDRWAHERGARMVSTLPLLAAFLDQPFEPSPYSPASRLFWNDVFVDVDRVPEVDPGARAAERPRPPPELRNAELVDYREVAAAKRAVLEPLAERFFRGEPPTSYRRFAAETPGLRDYARFRAEVDRRGEWWGAWPAAARDGRLRGAPEDDPAGRYHLYAQWLAAEQLAEVGERAGARGAGLLLDLPIGVNGAGYDVWRHRAAFALDASAGAPPDAFFSGGQDWGFPPLHPERIREDGYAYPRAAVATLLRRASAVRIDHVMGLHRLFWIPRGADPRHGAYVAYRAEEWYALLSIEANRAGAAIVGEDLGTVPASVRQAMRRHRVHTSYVIRFETAPCSSGERLRASGAAEELSGALRDPLPGSAASLGTHDLPTWAALWSGDDADVRGAIVQGLRARGLLHGRRPDRAEALEAALRFLARSDATLVIVALEDLWLEERPQNVPGTAAERGNWRGRLRLTLEELAADGRVGRLIEAVGAERAAVARRGEAA